MSRDMVDKVNSPNRNLAIVKAVIEQREPVAKVAKRFGVSRQRVSDNHITTSLGKSG